MKIKMLGTGNDGIKLMKPDGEEKGEYDVHPEYAVRCFAHGVALPVDDASMKVIKRAVDDGNVLSPNVMQAYNVWLAANASVDKPAG